jgi:hypothetical protein
MVVVLQSLKECIHQLVPGHSSVHRDIPQDRGRSADSEGVVPCDGDVVLFRVDGCQLEVGARLSGDLVSESRQGLRQSVARELARQLHNANTSSRTKCSRTTLGP